MALKFACGFECGTSNTGAGPTPDFRHYKNLVGAAPSISTTVVRSGGKSLRCNPVAGTMGLSHVFTAGDTGLSARVYIRFASLPTADTHLVQFGTATGSFCRLLYRTSTQDVIAVVGASTVGATAVPVSTGVWYRIDFSADVSGASRLCSLTFDGAGKGTASTAVAASTITSFDLGILSGTPTADVYFDDLCVGALADYPIGAGQIVGLFPNADGTHSLAATGNFVYSTGAGVPQNATDIYSYLRHSLDVVSTYLSMPLAAIGDYVEVQYDDMPAVASIRGAEFVSAHRADNTPANVQSARVVDGATVVSLYDQADFSQITLTYNSNQFATAPSTGLAWTKTLLDAIKTRHGGSFTGPVDNTPVPEIHGICIEVEYVPAVVVPDKLFTYFPGDTNVVTCVRASSATYRDSSAKVVTVGNNIARDSHYVPGVNSRGLLVEPARTNDFTQSETLNDAAYTAIGLASRVTGFTGPDGNATAWKITEDTTNGSHGFTRLLTTPTDNADQTFSIFVKAAERTWFRFIGLTKANTLASAYINLATGQVGTLAGSPNVVVHSYQNGWYRIGFTYNVGVGATAPEIRFRLVPTDATGLYTGDGVGGLYMWGIMWEKDKSTMTSYVATAGATATRSGDVISVPYTTLPQAETFWVDLYDYDGRKTTGARVFQVGNANPILRVEAASNKYQAVKTDGAGATVTSVEPQIPGYGTRTEILVSVDATGVVKTSDALLSGGEVIGAATAAQALSGAWGQTTLYLGSDGTANQSSLVITGFRNYSGSRTLAFMRTPDPTVPGTPTSPTTRVQRLSLRRLTMIQGNRLGISPSVSGGVVGSFSFADSTVDDAPVVQPNIAPTALFSSNATDLAVVFTDLSSDADGTIVSWAWTFGDNTSSTLRNPSHTYGSAGNYPVVLVVTDNRGATGTFQLVVSVSVAATTAPGGVIGSNVTINGEVFDRTGGLDAIGGISGNSHRTTQFNANWAIVSKKYVDAGIGASRTVWRNNALADGTLVNLSDPAQPTYPISRIGDASPGNSTVGNVSWRGGKIVGDLPQDGSISWDDWHAQSGLLGGCKNLLVELYCCYAKGDGIEITDIDNPNFADGTVIRWCAFEHCFDDCIENDAKSRITVYQCYMSGMQVFSARDQANTATDNFDASNLVYIIDGNISWLRPQLYADAAHGGGAPHAEAFFKWKLNTGSQPNGLAKGIPALLKNNVFRHDGLGQWGLDQTKLHASSINNVILFPTRSSGFPGSWPTYMQQADAGKFRYIYGQAAKDFWNSTVQTYQDTHTDTPIIDDGHYL